MLKDNKDIVVTINHGLDEYSIEKIQMIERYIDKALSPIGYTRSTSKKSPDKCIFTYYQFGFCN